jgi:hypothetical protein
MARSSIAGVGWRKYHDKVWDFEDRELAVSTILARPTEEFKRAGTTASGKSGNPPPMGRRE